MPETGTTLRPAIAAPRGRIVWRDLIKPVPRMYDVTAIVCVALSMLILAYAGRFGAAPILVLFLLWLPRAYDRRIVLNSLKNNRLPALYILYTVGSVLWSEHHKATLHDGLESASMIACALIASQVTSLRGFIRGMALGSVIVLVPSLINGRYGIDYFSGTYSLVGLFASKNQVGLFAEIGIFMALICLAYRGSLPAKFLFGLIPLTVGAVALYLSKSATSVASLAMMLAVCAMMYPVTRLGRGARPAIMMLVALGTVAVIAAGIGFGWESIGFKLLGKNATLTGRTYLWAQGLQIGQEKPLLGHAFGGFWVPGNPAAEALWYMFDIDTKIGFHFHNSYIQAFVDLGLIGLLIVIAMYGRCVIASFRYVMRYGFDLTGIFAFGLAVMYLIRSMVEVDIIGTFNIGMMLFYAIVPRLNEARAGQPPQTQAQREPPIRHPSLLAMRNAASTTDGHG